MQTHYHKKSLDQSIVSGAWLSNLGELWAPKQPKKACSALFAVLVANTPLWQAKTATVGYFQGKSEMIAVPKYAPTTHPALNIRIMLKAIT